MTIWLIAERTKYEDDANYDTIEECHGYFLTEESAKKKIASLYEVKRDDYNKYVSNMLRDNNDAIREYEEAVIKTDVLRANGFPDEPYPSRVPSCRRPDSFDDWLNASSRLVSEYVPYPLEQGEI